MGILLLALFWLGWHIGIYGLLKKAGVASAKAIIPIYNTWEVVRLCNISKFWFWIQFIPVLGQFVSLWISIIFVMHFKRVSLLDHALTVVLPFIYLPYIGFVSNDKWHGQDALTHYHKSASREWIDAAVFAVVAATLIRTFLFEAFVIPTESMEKTLLVNDFLFVDKVTYGARIPQTPLSFPFVHNTLPGSLTTPSYLKWIQLDYKRLPAVRNINRNDVVVFNFPTGDTIINLPEFGSKIPYYDVLRSPEFNGDREKLQAQYPILVHPMDKTDNYIKRCVGIPGDLIEVKKSQLYVNGHAAFVAPNAQTEYLVTTNGQSIPEAYVQDSLGISINEASMDYQIVESMPNTYKINMTAAAANGLSKLPFIKSVSKYEENTVGFTFPNDTVHFPFTIDNFGPIRIPKKGDLIALNDSTIELYRRLIVTYEKNTLEKVNGQYFLNGQAAHEYTVKQNYYWMMGDNRHRSQDSRFWGFVPETHIVGRAALIWFSYSNSIRWSRLFNLIK
ncbi:MAG: signal peptidase [Bacteroidota bacterium]|jgi:signal peptidase I